MHNLNEKKKLNSYRFTNSLGPDAIAVFAIAVILLSICLLWFKADSIENERLALRHKLIDIYTQRAQHLFVQMPDTYFDSFLRRFDTFSAAKPSAIYTAFAVKPEGICSGMLIYDANGNLSYPNIGSIEKVSSNADPNIQAYQNAMQAARLYPNAAGLKNWPDKTIRKLSKESDLYGIKFKLPDKTILAISNRGKMFSLTRASVKDFQDNTVAVQVFDNFGECIEGDPNLASGPFLTLSEGKFMPDFKVAVHFKDTLAIADAARKRTGIFIWIACLAAVMIGLSAAIAFRKFTAK